MTFSPKAGDAGSASSPPAEGPTARKPDPLAVFIHECASPLACAISSVDAAASLLDTDLPESRAALADGQMALRHLAALLSDVRARTLKQTDGPSSSVIDLGDVLDSSERILAPKLSRARLRRRRGPGVHVRAIESRVSQILVNLLSNAVDAIGSQGAIELRVRQQPPFASVEVEDDGPGVPPALEATLFEAFVTTKGAAGTGIGLHESRQLARAMGGDLVYRRAPSGGALFELRLPLATELSD